MLRYIFHISDLHINPKTIENIQSSFQFLITGIKLKNVDHSLLVIVGDIFDDKKNTLKISEYKVFKNICKELEDNKIKTLITPGNHDYNTNTKCIEDWPTTIIENEQYQYIKAYNSSQILDGSIFGYDNVEFYIIMPTESNNLPIPNNNDKIKIALLHEQINSAKYDNGVEITGGRFHSNDLSPFDYVMLGDIHKPQFLNSKTAYPGSFTQVNAGEGINHGCIIWDLEKKSGKHTYIPLKYMIVRVEKDDTGKWNLPNLEPWQNITTLIYNNFNCTEEDLVDLKNKYKEKYKKKLPNIEPINALAKLARSQSILYGENYDINIDISKISKDDFSLDHNAILKDILISINKADMIDEILHFHNKTLSEIRNINYKKYKLNYLVWRNMFCYGNEVNYIDFRNIKNELVILNGKNQYGKSAVIDILSLVLFNDTIRKPNTSEKKKKIININSKTFECKLSFSIDNEEYIIEQICGDTNNNSHKLYRKSDGKCLTKSKLTDTYKFMSEDLCLGNVNTFINTTAAVQNRTCLVDYDIKNNKLYNNVLSNIINTKDINIALELAKTERKKYSTNKLSKSELEDKKKYNLEDLNKLQSDTNLLKEKKDNKFNEINNIHSKIQDLFGQQQHIESYKDYSIENVDQIKNHVNNLKTKLKKIIENYDINKIKECFPEKIYSKISADIISCKEYINNNNESILNDKIKTITDITSKLLNRELSINDIEKIVEDGLPLDHLKSKFVCEINDTQSELSENDITEINKNITELENQINSKRISNKIIKEPIKPENYSKYSYYLEIKESGLPDYDLLEEELSSTIKDKDILFTNINEFEFQNDCSCCNKNEQNIYKFKDLYNNKISDIQNQLSQKDHKIIEYKEALVQINIIEEYKQLLASYNNYKIIIQIQDLNKKLEENTYKKKQNNIFRQNLEIDEYNKNINDKINSYNNSVKIVELNQKLELVKKYKEEYDSKSLLYEYTTIYRDYIKLKAILDKKIQNVQLDMNITSFQDQINKLQLEYNTLDNEYSEKNSEYSGYKQNYEARIEFEKKYEESMKKYDFFNTYINSIESNGLISRLNFKIGMTLQKMCNDILEIIADFKIEIDYKDKIIINIVSDTKRIHSAYASGYQKFIIDLLFRLIVLKISPASHSNMLFIDEGFGSLDEENFKKVVETLNRFKKNLDGLIIITHIPELKKLGDKIININRKGIESSLRFGNLTQEEITMSRLSEMKTEKENTEKYKENLTLQDEASSSSNPINNTLTEYINNNGGLRNILIEINGNKAKCRACSTDKKIVEINVSSIKKHLDSKESGNVGKKHQKYLLKLLDTSSK